MTKKAIIYFGVIMKKIQTKLLFNFLSLLIEIMPSRKLVALKLAIGASLLSYTSCSPVLGPSCYDPVSSSLYFHEITHDEKGGYIEVDDTIKCSVSLFYDDLYAYAIIDDADSIVQSGVFRDEPDKSYDTLIVLEKELYEPNKNYYLIYDIYDETMENPIDSLANEWIGKGYNITELRIK